MARPTPGPADHPGPLVFVDDLDGLRLDDADRHHLQRVLRLRPGDPLVVGDGAGAWLPARFGDDLEPVGDAESHPRPTPALTVGLTPVKGDRPEWAVQKLTELGVDRIVVLRAERSVVRWEGERAEGHLERLRRIAREAAMQSRRAWLPEVVGVLCPHEVTGAVLAEPGGRPPTADDHTVLCGPEGGWTDAERTQVGDQVGLGPHVLRAETATVAAATLLVGLRVGLVRPA